MRFLKSHRLFFIPKAGSDVIQSRGVEARKWDSEKEALVAEKAGSHFEIGVGGGRSDKGHSVARQFAVSMDLAPSALKSELRRRDQGRS
jgi:hypothetical protein